MLGHHQHASKHYLNGVSLAADVDQFIVVFGSLIPHQLKNTKSFRSWTPSDKIFWIRTCRILFFRLSFCYVGRTQNCIKVTSSENVLFYVFFVMPRNYSVTFVGVFVSNFSTLDEKRYRFIKLLQFDL